MYWLPTTSWLATSTATATATVTTDSHGESRFKAKRSSLNADIPAGTWSSCIDWSIPVWFASRSSNSRSDSSSSKTFYQKEICTKLVHFKHKLKFLLNKFMWVAGPQSPRLSGPITQGFRVPSQIRQHWKSRIWKALTSNFKKRREISITKKTISKLTQVGNTRLSHDMLVFWWHT